MPGSVKTEAVVLRSMRYGEADRILHLYTPHRGRVARDRQGRAARASSRFGGRLEPYFRLQMVLYEGRSELLTVTSARDVTRPSAPARARRRARQRGARVRRGRRACSRRPIRILACSRCCATSSRCSTRGPTQATHANQLAFRLKLLLAAGLAPQLAACASCGEADHLAAFSGAAGGVVCSACEATGFALGEEAHAFMTGALGSPLADVPPRRRARAAPGGPRDRRDASSTTRTSAGVRLRRRLPRL